MEDTTATSTKSGRNFGDEVARCVDGVTKLSKLDLASREERQAESVRKMLLAMVDDIRVIMVKLADRLHNMRTLGSLPRGEAAANRPGDDGDLCAHRPPPGHGKNPRRAGGSGVPISGAGGIRRPAATNSKRRAPATKRFSTRSSISSRSTLAREGIPARVEGRLKRAYSVFQKLKRQKIVLDQVYDLLAVRIITDSVKNCYAALGVIHNEWHPIPGRIKDFIAIPRPNLYQSLHTSVMGPGGRHFEVQIRTDEMHRIAEEGIAAHWKYKEGRRGPAGDDQRIAWLRQLVEWQREMRDPGEFMSTLKVDLYPEEVYSFTPKGRVIALPRGGTPIDFAYAIHSDVGNTCVGAKVNGRIVQLKHPLAQRRRGRDPDPDRPSAQQGLAGVVKTSRARNKIKHVINTTERAKAIEIGEKYLEREARRLGVQLGRVSRSADGSAWQRNTAVRKMEDLHAALGYGKYSARQVLQKIAPEQVPAEAPEPGRTRRPNVRRHRIAPGDDQDLVIKVKGVDDLLVYRAKCCNPDPRRSHRGLRDARQGHGGAFAQLHQRAEPDVRSGAEDRRGVGARGSETFPVSCCPHRGSAGNAEPAHHGAVQGADQHPQPGSARRRRDATATAPLSR